MTTSLLRFFLCGTYRYTLKSQITSYQPTTSTLLARQNHLCIAFTFRHYLTLNKNANMMIISLKGRAHLKRLAYYYEGKPLDL